MSVIRRFKEGRAPANWVCLTPAGPEVRFEHRGSGLCLEAVELDAGCGELGCPDSSRWAIRCRQYAGETACAKPLSYVENKAEAVDTLYDCMKKLNRQAARTEGTDYVTASDVSAILRGGVAYGVSAARPPAHTPEST